MSVFKKQLKVKLVGGLFIQQVNKEVKVKKFVSVTI
jgi:hypothetical protein